MKKIEIDTKPVPKDALAKFNPGDWIDRNLLAERVGGKMKLAEQIGRSAITVSRWMRKPGSEKAKEPSDYEQELLRRIWRGDTLTGLVSVN